MRRALLLTAILAGLALGYLYPPLDASRLYVYPYWATNPRADVAHYPLGGYFALFGEDSLNSIRMYRSPVDSMPYFRLVTKAGDTVRFNRGGIYTTGDVTADTFKGDGSLLTGVSGTPYDSAPIAANAHAIQTKDTTWIKAQAGSGSTDSIQRGVWLGSGWLKNDSTANVDSGAVGTWGDLRWLSLLGKAADATGADSADLAKLARDADSLDGHAASYFATAAAAAKAQDTANRALAGPDTVGTRSFGGGIWLAIAGKAADASGADSADVGVVSRSCTGNAATADSSTGGATRATLAANSSLLQGQDTTALWNAKTLQGKDTTDLDDAESVSGNDSSEIELRARIGAASGYCGLDGSALVDGDDLPALSTTKKGGAPATGTPSGKFLRDDATWQTVGGSGTVTDFHESLGVKLTPNPITTSGVVFLDTATVHTWVSGWAPGGTPDSDYVRITADSGRVKVLNAKVQVNGGLYDGDTTDADSKHVDKGYVDGVIHTQQHSITSTADHTSTATSGQMLKADANGLPVDASNTDAEVSAAVSASHSNANDPSADEKAALAGTDGTPSVTNKYVTNSDSRNSNARTPTAHTDSHKSGGSDDIPIDSLAAATDNTLLNATTSAHGLVVKATAPAAGVRNVLAIDNAETVYKNAALVDNTNPEALGAVGPGSQLVAARRDHVHPMPAIRDTAAIVAGDSADAARSDAADSAATYAGDTAAVLRAEAPTRDTSLSNPSTIAVNAGLYGQVTVTGLAQTLTIGAPTGSPLNGQRLTIRVKDDGTTRTLSWNAAFVAYTDVTLSTGTTAGKTMYWQALWNSTDSKWDVLASQVAP